MKICSNCGAQCQDTDNCCANCGAMFVAPVAQAVPVAPVAPAPAAPAANDHTADFTAEEISEGKLVAMIPYLFNILGIIVAVLLKGENKFIDFHIRAGIKICVIEAVLVLAMIVPVIGMFVSCVGVIIMLIVRIIGFFQVCGGKAKDPAIIGGFGFFK